MKTCLRPDCTIFMAKSFLYHGYAGLPIWKRGKHVQGDATFYLRLVGYVQMLERPWSQKNANKIKNLQCDNDKTCYRRLILAAKASLASPCPQLEA